MKKGQSDRLTEQQKRDKVLLQFFIKMHRYMTKKLGILLFLL